VRAAAGLQGGARLLGHQADVGDVAHRGDIELAVGLAVLDDRLVEK
tara:strand:- start:322 stop:459 length:138 start_codon:yes stop_codon:yes gene_type:complete